MGNFEIILIVFGTSGSIIVVLIVAFRWLGIDIFAHCRDRKKTYVAKCSELTCNESSLANLTKNKDQQVIKNQIWNSQKSFTSAETVETFDNVQDIGDTNFDSIVTQMKPALRYTVLCPHDENDDLLDDDIHLKLTETYGKLQIELSYNPFEEKLELAVMQAKDISILSKKWRENSNNENVTNYKTYLIVWLDDNPTEKRKSQIVNLDYITYFGCVFKWFVNDTSLMQIKVNIYMYLIDPDNGIESIFSESSIKVGEVYMFQPLSIWLMLHDPDKNPQFSGELLLSLSYLPTAERLTVIVIEARNLEFSNNFIFGDSFFKISIVDRNGKARETYKTTVRKNNPNPIFNEVTVFKASTKELNNLFVKVVAYELIKEKHIRIGEVIVGPRDENTAKNSNANPNHWQQMVRSLRRPVFLWHPIHK